jgi:S-adenosylmethionine decarboxylase
MHLLVELRDCNSKILNDLKKVEEILVGAAKAAKATIVKSHFHQFSPFGISGVVVIAESHLSVHTWPEYGYAAVDIFTCGDTLKPEVAAASVIEKFHSKQPSIIEVKRGVLSKNNVKLPHKTVKGESNPYARAKELQMVP